MSLKQIKHLAVETNSGESLGRVHDIVFDIDGHIVAQYVVKPSMISSEKLMISRSQVINITESKMIVDDNVRKVEEKEEKEKPELSPKPVAMREEV